MGDRGCPLSRASCPCAAEKELTERAAGMALSTDGLRDLSCKMFLKAPWRGHLIALQDDQLFEGLNQLEGSGIRQRLCNLGFITELHKSPIWPML